jgi:hypothetical protein
MMRNGIAYRLAPLAPLTNEIASGLLPTVLKADGTGQAAILSPTMSFVRTRTGRLRRVSHSGTWSIGLSRLMLLTFGRPLTERLAEWLMGFSEDWTALPLEPSATPSSLKSPNSSAAQS